MLKNIQINFRLKSLIAIFLTPILSLGFFVGEMRAEWANHLVISAVQITEGEGKTDHDFIEIYNPTTSDINLKGFRLVKRTKTGTSDTSIKSWTEDTIVKAHGWRLWASSDDKQFPIGIGADDSTAAIISPDNGIAIRFGALDMGEIIDAVAWGAAENIFKESVAAPTLGASEVLVRKPGAPNGNGEDANNNANDFSVVANFVPRNAQSTAEPVIENQVIVSLTPTLAPSQSSSSSPAAASIAQQSLPVAEAGIDKEAVIGENLDFDGSDSFDPAGKKLEFNWDFGDKTIAKGENVSHIYKAIGEYNVILKIDNGENTSEDTLKVKIIAPEFSDKIILNEILPNPIGVDKDGEWIELFNFGDKKVNLKGWILASDAKTGGKQYIFPGDKFIEAKSYLLIKRSESGLVLVNENGKVSLIWTPNKILSEASYGAAKDSKSYAFINNAWQWADIPTPSKENSAKVAVAPDTKVKENIAPAAGSSKSANNSEVLAAKYISGGEGAAMGDIASNSLLVKNTVSGLEKSASVEDFLNQLVSEKVDNAIRKAMATGSAPQEKTLALSDNTQSAGGAEMDKRIAYANTGWEDKSFAANNQNNTRNNPWFWGDLVLSALSLFLVWRYQEVRKKVNQF